MGRKPRTSGEKGRWGAFVDAPRFGVGVAVFFGAGAIAIGTYIARIAGGETTAKAISMWWVWPFVVLAIAGAIIPFTGRRGSSSTEGTVTPPPPIKRPKRFPTVDDVNRALGRDTSKGGADTPSSAPTRDG